MTTIKSFTDLEQSKKLTEILPIESADMYWWSSGKRYYIESIDDDDYEEDKDIRAWSFAALLDALPYGIIMNKDSQTGRYYFSSKYIGTYVTADNPVDACYEMILKLHELKLL